MLLNYDTRKVYFDSSQHNSILFYIFTFMTTCFCHSLFFGWNQNTVLL